ncbi:helix-turn-helix transcriptional regulator [Achromobacter sp. Marseille-Q0513]|uniref:AraC family transcriptional regulator n=1 Tax=Achromobacter sp. Marseille-Q0513 TaxID=2829161 RepID=UPI001B9FA09B|nr:helix-turn-helix transcriptional regulator [Achromobacter sp. Marseille-Q0513]MBR8657535.1 helix-turn-helix transcriptional regulator [Achromobacter sp. Marseille-Q0513]
MAKPRIPPSIEPIEDAGGPALIALRGGDDPDSPYRLGSREYDWHSHVRGQLFCVESGLVHVRTSHGSWLLPPQRAGWIPPGERHWADVSGAASGWSVIVAPAACAALPARPCVIGISELMQALVRRAVTWTDRRELAPPEARVAAVLLDEIQRAPREPLHLPMPSDPRLARIARAVYERPDDPRSLEDWARWGAVSPRTLRRLMAAETGMSFGRWRQQAGLIHALERLAQGEAVATVADALGYASPSGFIAMFRRAFGASPGRYFAQRQE